MRFDDPRNPLPQDQLDMIEAVSVRDGCVEVIPRAARQGDEIWSLAFFHNPDQVALITEHGVCWIDPTEV